jgi:hypothetical protein
MAADAGMQRVINEYFVAQETEYGLPSAARERWLRDGALDPHTVRQARHWTMGRVLRMAEDKNTSPAQAAQAMADYSTLGRWLEEST